MKIAVVGTGISGLVCGYLLGRDHDVTLIEANAHAGGHTNTVSVEFDGKQYEVDTGFIVYNEWTYPNFIGLLEELNVPTQETSMGFSVRCDRTGMEYNGSTLGGLFVQKRNLLSPKFYRMIYDILRFNKQGPEVLDELGEDVTVGEFLRTYRYSKGFAEHYLTPMGAAIWSCPMATFEQFPMKFIIEFYRNHGLLQVRDRPVWRVIQGGSKQYVRKLLDKFSGELRLNCPVQSVRRSQDHVEIQLSEGTEIFDEVVFACHSDTALKLLADAIPIETELLNEFPYGKNTAVLHNDESVLPSKPAWASWNYHIRKGEETRPSVTYNMNILQGLQSSKQFCVTLNEEEAINPDLIHGTFEYSHPIFTVRRAAAQRRHGEVIRNSRTSFCGAYWGNGFHEDGVNSALKVCSAYGIVPEWAHVQEES